MQLKTILNFVEKYKSFVYAEACWSNCDQHEIEFVIEPRRNSRPICSGCGKHRPGYHRLTARRFEFVPLWAIPVYFVYALRRVDCPQCGIVVEQVPWASGKNQQTHRYRLFLSTWAKRLSWQEVANIFGTSWDSVFRAIYWVVSWGVVHRELSSITAIGIDEIQYRRGHKYLTLVYQLDAGAKRLLYVAKDRREASLNGFFDILDKPTIAGIKFAWHFWHFWDSDDGTEGQRFFDGWYGWAIRSRLEPIKKVARMLKVRLPGLMSYFRHYVTNALTEGFNSKIQSIKSAARGFRSFKNYRLRILYYCGKLDLLPQISCH